MHLHHGKGRILVDITARPDRDLINRGRPEGDQEKQDRDNPEHRVLELIAQLEQCDGAKHRSPQAAAAVAVRRLRASVAK